jgi:hypothetical protein
LVLYGLIDSPAEPSHDKRTLADRCERSEHYRLSFVGNALFRDILQAIESILEDAMAFIPAADTAKVILQWASTQGNIAYNIIWVLDDTGGFTLPRLTTLNDVIIAWAGAEWDVVAASSWELDLVTSQNWSAENSTVKSTLAGVPGISANAALPAHVTTAISLRTGLAGRSNRGRLYHVGLNEDQVVGEFLDSADSVVIVGVYDQLRIDLQADDFQWAIASFVTNGAPRTEAQVRPITDILITDLATDSMVSRKAG